MTTVRVLSAVVVGLVSLAAALPWVNTQLAWAGSPDLSQRMVVIVADGPALRQSDSGFDLMRSLVGLVATFKEGQSIRVISVEEPVKRMALFDVSSGDFDRIQDEIEAGLSEAPIGHVGTMGEALTEAHSALAGWVAAPGSTVYILTGDRPEADFERMSRHLSPLAARFRENKWSVNGVGLPGSTAEVLTFLNRMAEDSNGQVFELSPVEGLRQLANSILGEEAKGPLGEIGSRQLSPVEVLTSIVSVAPGTRESTLVFFKASSSGSLRLSNPSGFETSVGDRTSSYVVDTPHLVVWKLIDPAPGNWKVNARGIEGLISAWGYSASKYNLVLSPVELVSITGSATLVAYLDHQGQPVPLKNVRLLANITTPGGTTLVYEMKDDGAGDDATAGDGYFSVTLTPQPVEGEYQAELELTWLDFNHTITSLGRFEARAFPAIEVRSVQLEDLLVGEATKVATVFVHVQGQPYPVDADQLTATLASSAGQTGTLELQPRRLFGRQGPAWEYDVVFTPQGVGNFIQVFRLAIEYAGRAYTHSSQSFVLSSMELPAPVELEAIAPPPVAVTEPAPPPVRRIEVPPPPPMPVVEPSRVSWLVLAAPVVVLIAAAAALVAFLVTRARPHGYLYSDNDEPLVDFAKVSRNPILAFLLRGSVRGKELNVPGLEGVIFFFSRGRIKLKSVLKEPTVRVNNQPLVGQATIEDRTWIGARGKLYTFVLSPSPAMGGATADLAGWCGMGCAPIPWGPRV